MQEIDVNFRKESVVFPTQSLMVRHNLQTGLLQSELTKYQHSDIDINAPVVTIFEWGFEPYLYWLGPHISQKIRMNLIAGFTTICYESIGAGPNKIVTGNSYKEFCTELRIWYKRAIWFLRKYWQGQYLTPIFRANLKACMACVWNDGCNYAVKLEKIKQTINDLPALLVRDAYLVCTPFSC